MRWRAPLMVIVVLLLLGAGGCSSGEGSGAGGMGPGHMESGLERRARIRHRAMMQRRTRVMRERRRAMRRRHQRMIARHRAEMRQLRAEEADRRAAEEAEAEEASTEGPRECDPNYTGACLDPNAADYDCADGSGNGPDYTGTVTVVGEDHYGLDADGDGIGCESE